MGWLDTERNGVKRQRSRDHQSPSKATTRGIVPAEQHKNGKQEQQRH
jgi:hypothetical protein